MEDEEPTSLLPKPLTDFQQQILKQIFYVCDSNHTGFMDFNELQDLFCALLDKPAEYEDLFAFFKEADKTNDGLLSLEEFMHMASMLLAAEEAKEEQLIKE